MEILTLGFLKSIDHPSKDIFKNIFGLEMIVSFENCLKLVKSDFDIPSLLVHLGKNSSKNYSSKMEVIYSAYRNLEYREFEIFQNASHEIYEECVLDREIDFRKFNQRIAPLANKYKETIQEHSNKIERAKAMYLRDTLHKKVRKNESKKFKELI